MGRDRVTWLQREAYICKRAYELASSGLHIQPLTILSVLVREGYPEAVDLMKLKPLRDDLRIVCAQNWKGVHLQFAPPPSPMPPPDLPTPPLPPKAPRPRRRRARR